MRTALIVYVTSGALLADDFDVEEAVRDLGIEADELIVVSNQAGHDDVLDAWWRLNAKGVHRIICRRIEAIGANEIRLSEGEIRLYG